MTRHELSRHNRLNSVLWLLVLIGFGSFVFWKVSTSSPFYSDITELLPKTQQQPEVIALEQQLQGQFSQQFLLLLRVKNTDASEQSQDTFTLAEALKSDLLASPLLRDSNQKSHLQQQLQTLFSPYHNQLLTPDLREELEQSSAAVLAEQAAKTLLAPNGQMRPQAFSQDPFNIAGRWLEAPQTESKITIKNGWPIIAAAKGDWYLINLQLNSSPFLLETQQAVLPIIDTFKQNLLENNIEVELLQSGLIFHAAAGADLAKHEMSTVGISSLLAIIFLVGIVFRSATPILGVLIALGGGLVCALAVSLLVFGRIHLLTLAFGSTLLGVAVDYCFHFMLNSQQLGCSQRCKALLGPALATSALSSIAAYLLQLATPFPGLQQMAVFSAAGLAGTWLSIMAFGPYYRPKKSDLSLYLSRIFKRHLLPLYESFRARHRLYMGVTCGLFLVSALIIQTEPKNNDVRSLNTSGESLIQASEHIQRLLEPDSNSRFFVVSATTEQQLLQRQEALRMALKPLHDRRYLNAEHSLADWSPSQTQQMADHQLIESKLYQQALPKLCEILGITDCRSLQASASSDFNPSLSAQALAQTPTLTPFMPVKINDTLHAVTLLSLNPLATDDDLRKASENISGVKFVNRVDDLSQLLVNYRQAVASYLAIALLLIAGILFYRYRSCGIRIMIPLTLAALVGLATAAHINGLTVFHLLAVLLVIGISLDTGIFYREMGLNGESWLAASLSSITSMLAFGLLCLSQVPVLHQFGVVVLSGILCSWLLTPVFFVGREDCNKPENRDVL